MVEERTGGVGSVAEEIYPIPKRLDWSYQAIGMTAARQQYRGRKRLHRDYSFDREQGWVTCSRSRE